MATSNISVVVKSPCITVISSDTPRIHQVVIVLAFSVLAIVTILSNAILMYTLYKTKQLNTISNKLILVMSISDMCLGAFALPIVAFRYANRNVVKGCTLDKASKCLILLFSFFSLLILYSISIDRYFKVTKLSRYNLYMNNFRMKLMIVVSLVAATLISVKSLLFPSFLQQVVAAAVGSLCVTFAIVVYMLLLRRLRRHMRHLNKVRRIGPNNHIAANSTGTDTSGSTTEDINETAPNRPTGNESSQLSAIKTIHFMLIFMIISYTPYYVVSSWWTYYKFHKKRDPGFNLSLSLVWAIFITLLNASGNSWIIICGNTQSRRFVSSLFRRSSVLNNSEQN